MQDGLNLHGAGQADGLSGLQNAGPVNLHLGPNEIQGVVLRELYRTADLINPLRTPANIRQWAQWPETVMADGIEVTLSYLSDSCCRTNNVPGLADIVLALRALYDQELILADRNFVYVALAPAGRKIIDALPADQRPEKAFQIVYGGGRD